MNFTGKAQNLKLKDYEAKELVLFIDDLSNGFNAKKESHSYYLALNARDELERLFTSKIKNHYHIRH